MSNNTIDRHRLLQRGSGLAMVMAFVVIGTMAIVVSTNLVHRRQVDLQQRSYQDEALGALEAVLAKHETRMLELSVEGDPAGFSGFLQNYGQERFGRCLVRWRVEPAIIEDIERIDQTIDTETSPETINRTYISNPTNGLSSSNDVGRVPNEYVYLYRLAAHARLVADADSWNPAEREDVLSEVQGVRYIAITKVPTYRYVIWYTQNGTKGDLEITHGNQDLQIRGNVKSHGAIYLGGGTRVNVWSTLRNIYRGKTLLGPAAGGRRIEVTGVNGVFRLDKKSMFSAFNVGNHMTQAQSWTPSEYSTTGPTSAFYDPDPLLIATGEEGARPDYLRPESGADVLSATRDGTIINPNRIKDASELAAADPSGKELVTINDDAQLTVANDSRRPDWRTRSMQAPVSGGFYGYVRTKENGGSREPLATWYRNRPMEVQRLVYREMDGDLSEDEHEFAMPLFLDDEGREIDVVPDAGDPIIESPGTYLRYVFGELPGSLINRPQFAFRRRTSDNYPAGYDTTGQTHPAHAYNGWDVIGFDDFDEAGRLPARRFAENTRYGLVIRERPQPDLSYIDGIGAIPSSSEHYLPYAYGKAYRAPIWPWFEMDIVAGRTDHVIKTGRDDRGDPTVDGVEVIAGIQHEFDYYMEKVDDKDSRNHINERAHFQLYRAGGQLGLEAACYPGPDGRTDKDKPYESYQWDDSQDGWFDYDGRMRHYPDYYRENWRFFHMRRPNVDESRRGTGLVMEWFANTRVFDVAPTVRQHPHVFGDLEAQRPVAMRGALVYSTRWSGFITPQETGDYRFRVRWDDGVRVWLDGDRLDASIDSWSESSGGTEELAPRLLNAGQDYFLVIEHFNGYDTFRRSDQSRAPDTNGRLEFTWWGPNDADFGEHPSLQLSPSDDPTMAVDDFQAVQMRIRSVDGPDRQKVGLMLRPNMTRQSLMHDPDRLAVGSGGPLTIEADLFVDLPDTDAAPVRYVDGLDGNWDSVDIPLMDDGSGNRVSQVSGDRAARAGGGSDDAASPTASYVEYDFDVLAPGSYTVSMLMRSASSSAPAGVLVGVGTEHDWDNGLQDWLTPPNDPLVATDDAWEWRSQTAVSSQLTFFTVPVGEEGIYTLRAIKYSPTGGTSPDALIDQISIATTGSGEEPTPGSGYRVASGGGSWPPVYSEDTPTLSHLGDGRAPYLALLYSPDRGVFAQYRGDTATTVTQNWNTWFVGSNAAGEPRDGSTGERLVHPDTGETAQSMADWETADVERTVRLIPERIYRKSDGLPETLRKHDEDQFNELSKPKKYTTRVRLAGDGGVGEIEYYVGIYSGYNWRQGKKHFHKRGIERWDFVLPLDSQLDSASQLFDRDDDEGLTISLFVDEKATPTVLQEPMSHDKGDGYHDLVGWYTGHDENGDPMSLKRAARIWASPFITFNPSYSLGTESQFQAAYESMHSAGFRSSDFDYSNPPEYSGPRTEGETKSYGGDKKIWVGYSKFKPKFKGFERDPTATQMLDLLQNRYASGDKPDVDAIYQVVADNRIHFPEAGKTFAPPDPPIADPDLDAIYGWDEIVQEAQDDDDKGYAPGSAHPTTEPITFSVNRRRRLHIDVNPYITNMGRWYPDGVREWPALPAWANDRDALRMPLTGGLRPDLWYFDSAGDAVLPLSGSTAKSPPLPPIDLSRDPYQREDPNRFRSSLIPPRWRGDHWEYDGRPMTLDGADASKSVWLRIERAPGSGNRAMLLYYYGSSSDPAPSDFRPVYHQDRSGSGAPSGVPSSEIWLADLDQLGDRLLVGPCIQSGDHDWRSSVVIDEVQYEFRPGAGNTPVDDVDILDAADWESNDNSRVSLEASYMASQYQVFFGPFEITEAFFAYRDVNGESPAREDWIINPREWMGVSRWWACGAEMEDWDRDGEAEPDRLYPDETSTRTARELFAKQTLLTVNVRALQNFLINTDLYQATRGEPLTTSSPADYGQGGMDGGYDDSALPDPVSGGLKLKGLFATNSTGGERPDGGLLYFVRTNRYPFNPNVDPAGQPNIGGNNPWTWPLVVPNQCPSGLPITGADVEAADVDDKPALFQELVYGSPTSPVKYDPGQVRDRYVDWNTHPRLSLDGSGGMPTAVVDRFGLQTPYADSMDPDAFRLLQPYWDLPNAPAIRPEDFHHGVRLVNAESIDWGLPVTESGGPIASTSDPINIYDSYTRIVTPSQLLIKGSVNVRTYSAVVEADGAEEPNKTTPLALVGDSITVLSDDWEDRYYQEEGFRVESDGRIVGGSVARIYDGRLTTADRGIVLNAVVDTHHQPTTKRSVINGKAASLINIFQFIEDWPQDDPTEPDSVRRGNSFVFNGSLVVMDSRRYSDAPLGDYELDYGPTPFGVLGWHYDLLTSGRPINNEGLARGPIDKLRWENPAGGSPTGTVYDPPRRVFEYNVDLLTPNGTPPFSPYGLTSAANSGGWVKVLK